MDNQNNEIGQLVTEARSALQSLQTLGDSIKDLASIALKGQQAKLENIEKAFGEVDSFMQNMVIGGLQSIEFQLESLVGVLIEKDILKEEEIVAYRKKMFDKIQALQRAQGGNLPGPEDVASQEQIEAVLSSLYNKEDDNEQ